MHAEYIGRDYISGFVITQGVFDGFSAKIHLKTKATQRLQKGHTKFQQKAKERANKSQRKFKQRVKQRQHKGQTKTKTKTETKGKRKSKQKLSYKHITHKHTHTHSHKPYLHISLILSYPCLPPLTTHVKPHSNALTKALSILTFPKSNHTPTHSTKPHMLLPTWHHHSNHPSSHRATPHRTCHKPNPQSTNRVGITLTNPCLWNLFPHSTQSKHASSLTLPTYRNMHIYTHLRLASIHACPHTI